MRDIGTALIWAALIPLTFWSAHIGALLWTWTALIAPNELLYGFMHSMPLNKLATALTIFALALNREWKDLYFDSTQAILLALTLSATVSAVMAIGPEAALLPGNAHLYERFLKVLALAFIICAVMGSRWRVHAVVLTVCIAFGFNMVTDGLKFLVTAGAHRVVGKTSVGDNNQLALAFLVTLPLILYTVRHSAVRATKLAFGALLVIGVIAVIGTFSRGGFIGLLFLALWLVAGSRHKIISFMLVAAAAGVLYSIIPESYFQRVDTINSAEQDQSFMDRVIAWKISALIALDRPFTGGGFWAVQLPEVWNHYRLELDTLDIVKTPPPGTEARAAHSIYFEMLGDQGFLGLGLFLLLIAHSLFRCRQIRLASRGDASKAWAGDLAAMLQISLIVYCVSGALVSMARFEAIYVLIAVVSRLNRIVRIEASAAQAAPNPAEPSRRSRRPAVPRPVLASQGTSRGWRGRTASLPRT